MLTESLTEVSETNCSTPVFGSIPLTTQPAIRGRGYVRRKISPSDGRALEMLGHSIEYLADEYVLSGRQLAGLATSDPRIEAIQILMAANRAIYHGCPEVEPVFRRLARLFPRLFLGSRVAGPPVASSRMDRSIRAHSHASR